MALVCQTAVSLAPFSKNLNQIFPLVYHQRSLILKLAVLLFRKKTQLPIELYLLLYYSMQSSFNLYFIFYKLFASS